MESEEGGQQVSCYSLSPHHTNPNPRKLKVIHGCFVQQHILVLRMGDGPEELAGEDYDERCVTNNPVLLLSFSLPFLTCSESGAMW